MAIRETYAHRIERLMGQGFTKSQARGHAIYGELGVKLQTVTVKEGLRNSWGNKALVTKNKEIIEQYKQVAKVASRDPKTGRITWKDSKGNLIPEAKILINKIRKHERKEPYDFGPGDTP